MPDTAANHGNQRVTNVMLGAKIDAVQMGQDHMAQRFEDYTDAASKVTLDHETRIRKVEKTSVQHTEQIKLRTMILGAYSTFGAALSGLAARFWPG